MEMVHSDLALRGIPPAITNARPKVALHRLTDLDVFVWDLVAECYELRPLGVSRDVSGRVCGKPFEHHDRTIARHRHDDVCLHLPHVHIEQDVGEDPAVHGLGYFGLGKDRISDRDPLLYPRCECRGQMETSRLEFHGNCNRSREVSRRTATETHELKMDCRGSKCYCDSLLIVISRALPPLSPRRAFPHGHREKHPSFTARRRGISAGGKSLTRGGAESAEKYASGEYAIGDNPLLFSVNNPRLLFSVEPRRFLVQRR